MQVVKSAGKIKVVKKAGKRSQQKRALHANYRKSINRRRAREDTAAFGYQGIVILKLLQVVSSARLLTSKCLVLW